MIRRRASARDALKRKGAKTRRKQEAAGVAQASPAALGDVTSWRTADAHDRPTRLTSSAGVPPACRSGVRDTLKREDATARSWQSAVWERARSRPCVHVARKLACLPRQGPSFADVQAGRLRYSVSFASRRLCVSASLRLGVFASQGITHDAECHSRRLRFSVAFFRLRVPLPVFVSAFPE